MGESDSTVSLPDVGRRSREKRSSLVFYHRGGSEIAPLLPDATLVVGRTRPADVAINDPSLSRQHARFTREGDAIWVEDLGSTNGTRVRGKKITRTRIKLDDEVDIGAVSASVHVLSAQEPELGEMESHDRFVSNLEDEVVRARTFGRQLGLLMVSAATRQKAQLLVQALQAHGWNQTATADALGMPLRTLFHKIKRYGIQKKHER